MNKELREPKKLGFHIDEIDTNDYQYNEVYGAAPADMPDWVKG